MAKTVVAEDIAPLLVKDEPDNFGKDLDTEMAVPSAGVNSKGNGWNIFAFLYQHSTYYWIAFIAQFSQVTLQSIGFAVAAAYKEFKGTDDDNLTYTGTLFLASGVYSSFTLLVTAGLILVHYKGRKAGPKHVMAGKHVVAGRFCAVMDFANLIIVLGHAISHHSDQVYVDGIRPIIVPLIIGFLVVSGLAHTYATAAFITYVAAKRARGTDPVPDPDHRVPAWTLSTTEESQSLWRQNPIQLPL